MSYPSFIKTNWQWLLTVSFGFVVLLLAANTSYNGICNRIDKIAAVQLLQGDLLIQQGTRVTKLEAVVSLKPIVDVNTVRIDRLEKFMEESAKDRSALNARLDLLQSTLEKLVAMHMKQ